jgi:methionyl-tRNA formyltransferase
MRRLRIWSARVVEYTGDAPPGTLVASGAPGIDVATGRNALRILSLQASGRRPTSSADYLNAHPLSVGQVLEGAGGARA